MTESTAPLDIEHAKSIAADFIAGEEDCRLVAYPDPYSDRMKAKRQSPRPVGWAQLSGAPWTIGFGHIKGVKEEDTCTADQAKAWLHEDLNDAVAKVRLKIGNVLDELTPHQAAAIFSFAFNLGTGDPKKPEWQIWRLLRGRRFDQVPLQFPKFVNANGVKSIGLVKRRANEQILWATDEPGTSDVAMTSGALRIAETPPTPADPVPAHKSATVWATLSAPFIAAFAALHDWVFGIFLYVKDWITPDTVNHGIAAIQPYADKSPWVANALQGLAVAGAALAAVLVLRKKGEGRK